MELSWIVLLPPLCVLAIAITTHSVLYALFSGIVVSCLIIAQGNPLMAAAILGNRILEESSLLALWNQTGSYDHLYTFGFLIGLGIIIELMAQSGGLLAYAQLISKYIKTKKQAEALPLVVAPLFFLDDYLNNLVGGSVIRPLFDQFDIAREKLAYLLNAVSSSQCLLVPASSWLALILMQLQAVGVSNNLALHPTIIADPYTLYLSALPYLLYPILSIVSAWFMVGSGLSYGPMARAELTLKRAPRVYMALQETAADASCSLSNFAIPLVSFLLGIPLMMLYLGGWHPAIGSITWKQALQNTDVLFAALWWASVASCVLSSIFLRISGTFSWQKLGIAYYDGFSFMKNSLLLLLFAWTLSSLLKHDVPAGAYLAQRVVAHAPLVIIPLMCFLTSTIITAAVGSSWGMIGIMLPVAIPLITTLSSVSLPAVAELLPLLLPTIGAILSGAAAGPHFSPITDAAIISSTTAGISPLEHIRTMLPYSLPPFIAAALGFVVYALLPVSSGVKIAVIMVAIGAMILLHLLLAASYKKRNINSSVHSR